MSKLSQEKRRRTIDVKRGEYTQLRKNKFDYLRNSGKYNLYYNAKRGIKIIKKPKEQAKPLSMEYVPVAENTSLWKGFLKLLQAYVGSILRLLWRRNKTAHIQRSINETKSSLSNASDASESSDSSATSSASR